MPIKQFFEKKGYSDVEIVNERIGILNIVYTIRAGKELFFYKKPDNTSPLSENLDPKRVVNEYKGILLASSVIDNVPKIFHFEKRSPILITTAPDEKSSLLRYELLDGNLDLGLIKNLAKTIKQVHSIKFDGNNENLDPKFFHILNTEVFYLKLKDDYPKLINALIENINEKKCLVHGDFNPKNIVVYKDRFVIIDWEKAFFSSPEVDLGNMFAHFIIKGLHLKRKDYLKLPEIFLDAYGNGYNIEMINGHIGVNIWSRVGSIAKARYLTKEGQAKVWREAKKYLKGTKI